MKAHSDETRSSSMARVLWAGAAACVLAVLLGGCGANGPATRRIEPGDIVFKDWTYVTAYKDDVSRIIAAHGPGDVAAIARGELSAAELNRSAARINQGVAELTAKYLESGRLWEVPAGTVVAIEEYYDGRGNVTNPKIKGEWLYSADGNQLIAKIDWNGRKGFMAVDRTQ